MRGESSRETSAAELMLRVEGCVLNVTFNRPEKRNAMTWPMYDGLMDACEQADSDAGIRVMVLRGAGDQAFVAGTDIAQFLDFDSGSDGLAYEQRIGRVLARLEAVRVPTVAAVHGFCLGGGLAIAAVCDLRIATTDARFGVPIARTVGNCLSTETMAVLIQQLGAARTLDLLFRARLLGAIEAEQTGFVCQLVPPAELDRAVAEICDTLASHAPLTMWAAKESVRRARGAASINGDDIVRTVYGSSDFRHGVRAFLDGRRPEWSGS